MLKRGIPGTASSGIHGTTVLDGSVQRKQGSIVMLDDAGQEVLRWNFHRGWPRKYEAPTFNAKTSAVAIETLEITHEGFELA